MSTGSSEELLFIMRMRDEASRQLDKFNDTVKDTEETSKKAEDGLQKLTDAAKVAAVAFAAVTASFAVMSRALKVFGQYEQGMLGVQKTTNLSRMEMQLFDRDFAAMAQTMAVPITSLQAIAQTAGQLGIQGREDLLRFTEIVAKLETASDLTGEAAAFALSRITTITGEGMDGVEALANTLVELGNNFAATESQILSITAEVARSTSTFDLSSSQLAAYGAALAQLGVRAETGGTSIGRTFRAIAQAAAEGGDAMEAITRITGITQEAMLELIQTNPERAMAEFLKGLKKVVPDTVALNSVLKDLGLNTEEIQKTIVPLANNFEVLAEAQARAASESQRLMALQKEYELFASGYTAAVGEMNNSLQMFTIRAAEAFSPIALAAIADVTLTAQQLTAALTALPDVVQTVIVAVAVLTSTLWALMGVLKVVGISIAPFAAMATAAKALGAGLTLLGGPALAAGVVIGGVGLQMYGASKDAKAYAETLSELEGAYAVLESAVIQFERQVTAASARALQAIAEDQLAMLKLAYGQAEQQANNSSFWTNFFGLSLGETEGMRDAKAALEDVANQIMDVETLISAAGHRITTLGGDAAGPAGTSTPAAYAMIEIGKLSVQASQSVEDLDKKFMDLSSTMQQVNDAKQALAMDAASSALNASIETIASMTTHLQLGSMTAQGLAADLNAVAQNGNFAQQSEQLADMAQQIYTANGGLDDMSEETRNTYQALLDAATTAADLAIAAGQISFGGAITSAQNLATQLGISLGLARQLAGISNGSGGTVVMDPRDPRYDADAARLARTASQMASLPTTTSTAGSFLGGPVKGRGGDSTAGGGGGSSSGLADIEDALAAYEKQTEVLKLKNQLMSDFALADSSAANVAALLMEAQAMGQTESQLVSLRDRYLELIEARNQMQGGGASFFAALNSEYQSFTQTLTDATALASNVVQTLGGASSNFLDRMMNQNQTFMESLRGAVSDTLSEIGAMILDHYLKVLIFKNMLGGSSGPLGFLGGALGFAEKGAAFYAKGGTFTNSVVNQPTPFNFASGGGFGLGVMGEAGPEAIMPLTRGKDGNLGVRSSGGSGGDVFSITTNVTLPSNGSGGGSKEQKSAMQKTLANQVRTAVVEIVTDMSRPGGLLAGAR